jgi:hypothetical protein
MLGQVEAGETKRFDD